MEMNAVDLLNSLTDMGSNKRKYGKYQCKNRDYIPTGKTMKALVGTVRKLTGKQVKSDDFWM